MDVLAGLSEAGLWLLRVLLLLAPLLAWQWTFALLLPQRPRFGPAVLTLIASVMVGLAALVALLPPAILTWDAIVTPGGFWDMPLPDFLTHGTAMERRALPALLEILRSDDERWNYQAWLAVALALWLLRLLTILIAAPHGTRKLLILLAEVVGFAVGTLATIFTGLLLLWLLNRLNFWLFLVLILLIQDYRYCEPPWSWRLVGWLDRMPYRFHWLARRVGRHIVRLPHRHQWLRGWLVRLAHRYHSRIDPLP